MGWRSGCRFSRSLSRNPQPRLRENRHPAARANLDGHLRAGSSLALLSARHESARGRAGRGPAGHRRGVSRGLPRRPRGHRRPGPARSQPEGAGRADPDSPRGPGEPVCLRGRPHLPPVRAGPPARGDGGTPMRPIRLLSAAVAPLAALWLAACGDSEATKAIPDAPAAAPRPIAVATATVEERAVPATLEVTGTLTADARTDVAAEADGRIVQVTIER